MSLWDGNKLAESQSTIRRHFNPTNKEDLKVFKSFKKTGTWGGPCPFILEYPYLDIPTMLDRKVCEFALSSVK